jgi:hypothetical protein
MEISIEGPSEEQGRQTWLKVGRREKLHFKRKVTQDAGKRGKKEERQGKRVTGSRANERQNTCLSESWEAGDPSNKG